MMLNRINHSIKTFIGNQSCASICGTDSGNRPFCFTCLYSFDSSRGLLYFKSSAESFHSRMLKSNPQVSGTILPDTFNKLRLRGIQFDALILEGQHPLTADASALYHKKYRIALAVNGEVRVLQLNRIKLTDNVLGFGQKCTWYRNEQFIMADR